MYNIYIYIYIYILYIYIYIYVAGLRPSPVLKAIMYKGGVDRLPVQVSDYIYIYIYIYMYTHMYMHM